MKKKIKQLKEERRQLYIEIHEIRDDRNILLMEQRPLTIRLYQVQEELKRLT